MADREAKLRMVAEFFGLDEGSAKVRTLVDSLEQLDTAGEATAGALQTTATAIDGVTAAEQESTRAAQQNAEASRQMAQETRESGLALEVQRTGLRAMVSELQAQVVEYAKSGAAGREAANVTGQALTEVKAKLADVNAQIKLEVDSFRKIGDEGKSAFGEIRGAALSFEQTAEVAAQRVRAGWESYNTELKITPRQLGLVAQAVESLKIKMVEAGERGEQATVDQIATYKKLETELTLLTAKTNQLSNAAKDNAVRLKESGNQIQGLAGGVAQLTSVMGPQAAQVGYLIGNVGQLGGAYESLKDSIAGLDLNTIAAGGSMAKYGAQVAAVVGTLAAAIAIGKEVAMTSETQRSEWDKLEASVKKFSTDALAELKDRLGQTQDELAKTSVEMTDFQNNINSTNAQRFITSILGVDVAMRQGRDGANLFYQAVNNGFSALDADRLGSTEAAVKAFTAAQKSGADGAALWSRAITESDGNLDTMMKRLPGLIKEIDALTEAQKRNAASPMAANLKLVADAIAAATLAEKTMEQATFGTTVAITALTAEMQKYITGGQMFDAQSVALGKSLLSLLEHTRNLSTEERAQIVELANLAAKTADLTKADQARAVQIITAIQNQELVKAKIVETTKAVTDLADVQLYANTVQESLNVAQTEHVTGLQSELVALRELIAAKEREAGVTQESAEINMNAGASLEFLRMQEAALTQEIAGQSSVVHANTETIDRENKAREEQAARLAQMSAANRDAVVSSSELVTVNEGGRQVVTNLTEAQREATKAITESGQANKDVVSSIEDVDAHVRKVKESTDAFGTSATTTSGKVQDLGTKTADSTAKIASALQTIGDQGSSLPEKFAALLTIMPQVNEQIAQLEKNAKGAGEELGNLATSVAAANDAATSAAR